MTVSAYAKINLTLEVYGWRPDGFHALKSIVQPIALADTLEVEATSDGALASDTGYGEKDLCIKAAKSLKSKVQGLKSKGQGQLGARIHVEKRIPVGGGLGGGSADAAATLRALNALWNLSLPPERLAEIGAEVGSDVPALVLAQEYARPVLMEGRGERVSLLPASEAPVCAPFLILATPPVASSTAEIYAHCTPRTEPAKGAVNDLQAPACAAHPEIAAALAALVVAGASDVMMSGSGSTVFGFAPDAPSAEAIAATMRALGCTARVTSFLRTA